MRLGLGYIIAGEMLIGSLAILCAIGNAINGADSLTSVGVAIAWGLLAALSYSTVVALYRGLRWAWFASWIMGLIAVGFSLTVVISAFRPQPLDLAGEEPFILATGILILIFCLIGLVLLAHKSTRKFLHV